MEGSSIEGLPMPEDPQLRRVAEELERNRQVAEIYDERWRIVYISSEMWRAVSDGRVLTEMYGMGPVRRAREFPEWAPPTADAQLMWMQRMVPHMLDALAPGTAAFEQEFEALAPTVAEFEPKPLPALSTIDFTFTEHHYGGFTIRIHTIRVNAEDGALLGTIWLHVPPLPGRVNWLLARGDEAMYERMAAMQQPHRCPTALLFCDIERSGELSRRLSAHGYFDLIKEITTAIDREVAAHRGIVGKHAGDGASAFFCTRDHAGSESAACRSAIEVARGLRAATQGLEVAGEPVAVNCGLHWGGTVVMGQVAEGGRLEITALGDEVNEAARIEAVAKGGVALASKQLVERLDPGDAGALGLELQSLSYRTVASLEGASAKAVRDAGSIPVTQI